MNIFFLVLISVVLLIIVLILIQSKDENTNEIINLNTINHHKITLDEIQLPRKIEKLDYSSLFQACKVIFDSFKALDYLNRPVNNLDRLEWHSWQISLLLAFMKVYNNFFVTFNKDLFHKVILELNEKDIDFEIERILKKYNNHVNIDKTRDELSKDLVWSARDVSIILYSVMSNKRY